MKHLHSLPEGGVNALEVLEAKLRGVRIKFLKLVVEEKLREKASEQGLE